MYVYLLGELKDSFKVSTGLANRYETPEMSLQPYGPVLTKYSSKTFPGGNYKGLGNMPYAVFLQNGYAIHGTTIGNFSKLGNRASHGCVRLHPDNAKVFNALVKTVGLANTWVSIRDSLTTDKFHVLNEQKK
jgi:lipoprotein-anchoring transpeptidase ErfK/SrfK